MKFMLLPRSDTYHFSLQKFLQNFKFIRTSHNVPLNHKGAQKKAQKIEYQEYTLIMIMTITIEYSHDTELSYGRADIDL